MPEFTVDQIVELAPDAKSVKAGQDMASKRKWVLVGRNEQTAWGECQGSAKQPYQTIIDLAEISFKCSCPSRKFPCKHALGLFILLASQPEIFQSSAAPGWVSDWLLKRTQSKKTKSEVKKIEARKVGTPEQKKQVSKREARVREGLVELDLWLSDLVRQGLDSAQTQSLSYWENAAARLVDAQAPGLARMVREMASFPASGEGWQEKMLSRASALYLLIKGYDRLDLFPQETQQDVRAYIGWTQPQEQLLEQDGVEDNWAVLGKHEEEQKLGALQRSTYLRVQRTWLWGKNSQKAALILAFAAPGQSLETKLIPGTFLDAELVYYPSGYPLRALIKKQRNILEPASSWPGFSDFIKALDAYHSALAANPWLDIFPMVLNDVIPVQIGERWGIFDRCKRYLPVSLSFDKMWSLVAISGGKPIDLVCEWDGSTLLPLSSFAEKRFIRLSSQSQEGT